MPIFQFADQFAMFDVTPLENLFIEEYMLRAPGDFVKVYIYGLRLCYHPGKDLSIPYMARAMGLEEETVISAFDYWERMGVLRRIADNPPAFAYYNLKEAILNKKAAYTGDDLPYREFNSALQDIFGDRLLQAADYQRIYGWVEGLSLPQDVVLLLVAHMVQTGARKQRIGLSIIEREAKAWAKKGINTKALAMEHLRTQGQNFEGAKRVLRQLGLSRAPTVDEEALFAKWTEKWDFTMDSILFACKETTKISNPNFAYLDAVLRARHEKNLATPQSVEEHQQTRKASQSGLRRVLTALGDARVSPTDDLMQLYEGFIAQGFSEDAIVMAAKYALRRGGKSMDDVSRILVSWGKQNLYTLEQIEDFLLKSRQSAESCAQVYAALGLPGAPSAADKKKLSHWQENGASMELILLAAEYAGHAKNPFAYMDTILNDWLSSGITKAQQAIDAREQRKAGAAVASLPGPSAQARQRRPSKEVSAHRVAQRSYTTEELEKLYTSIDELDKILEEGSL